VIEVNDELQVRIPDSDRREDAELREAALRALMLDSPVPASVDAKVEACQACFGQLSFATGIPFTPVCV
jgi:hypothetical protein